MSKRRIQSPKGKQRRLSLRHLAIFFLILFLCTLLFVYIYFSYIHKVTSAYDFHLRPTTPNQFISADYDFLHGLSGNGRYSDENANSKLLAKNRKRRKKNFPNVEERVQLYMSNWYQSPCNKANKFGLLVDERLSYSYDGPKRQAIASVENIRDVDKEESNIAKNKRGLDFYEVTFGSREADEMMYSVLDTQVSFNEPFVLQMDLVQPCIHNSEYQENKKAKKESLYCEDALDILNLLPKIEIEVEKSTVGGGATTTILSKANMVKDWNGKYHPLPIIVQFLSDHNNHTTMKQRELNKNPIPYLHEYRPSTISRNAKKDLRKLINDKDLDCRLPGLRKNLQTIGSSKSHQTKDGPTASYVPIIWFINSKLHLKKMHDVLAADIPWTWKKDKAIIIDVDTTISNISMPNSNVLITREKDLYIQDTKSFDHIKRIENILEYKIIIIPSSDRVESLNEMKWALYSRSVVLMPRPKLTSFVMEELLEPFVHYIPLKDNYDQSDLETQLSWIMKHEKKARHIAERGTLFIHDLFFHEDSKDDNNEVQLNILKKYSKFFVNSSVE